LVGEIRVGNLRALGRHVARYGSNAEVLGPELARTAVKDYALAALALQEQA
jgi:predicted DNA-binding transcriptional regulator YafY